MALAFHQQVFAGGVTATPSYTSPEFNRLLGSADSLYISSRVSQVLVTGLSIKTTIEHSNTGGAAEEWKVAGAAVITGVTKDGIVVAEHTFKAGTDGILAAFVRIKLEATGTTANLYAEVWATGRAN